MIDEKEIDRRRRAIYRALLPFFKFDQLMKAMWIWELQYSRQDTISYNKFTIEICDNDELKAARAAILNSMARTMSLRMEELDYDPYPKILEYRGISNTSSRQTVSSTHEKTQPPKHDNKLDSKLVIFEFLTKNIYKEIINSKPSIKDLFIQKLDARLNGINPATKKTISNIITSGSYTDISISMEDQKNTIHSMYAIGCEYIGAPATDKLMSRVFKAAEELPEALNEKPKL